MKQDKKFKIPIMSILIMFSLTILSALISAQNNRERQSKIPDLKPRVKIMSPEPGKMWVGSLKIWLSLRDIDADKVRVVEIYLDGRLLRELVAPPYNILHEFGTQGQNHTLKVFVRDHKMNVIASAENKSFQVDVAHNVEVKRVMVPVVVKDYNGNFVRGLKKEDFKVLSDGKPVKLAYLETAGTNRFNLIQVIDISYSMKEKIHDVIDAAAGFLKELKSERDQGAFVFFNHIVFDYTDVTSQMDKLVEDLFLRSPVAGNTALYDALAYTLDMMSKQRGWNIIVLFSDGLDNSSYIDYQSLLQKVKKSAVVIYAVDNTGSTGKRIKEICNFSGGKTFPLSNVRKTRKVYDRIREDIKASYVLFFNPPHGASRRFHKLSVSVKGKKYNIHTLKGYY